MTATAMAEPRDPRARSRRNVWLALAHAALAAAILVAFVWYQVTH